MVLLLTAILDVALLVGILVVVLLVGILAVALFLLCWYWLAAWKTSSGGVGWDTGCGGVVDCDTGCSVVGWNTSCVLLAGLSCCWFRYLL